jgi:hypothetical protein
MKTKLNNIIYDIVGLILFVIFIWYRFMRERLPKDIPFNLTIVGLFVLLWICMIYIYIVYTLSTEKKLSNAFLSNLINNIFKPLEALDHSIKSHRLINPYYKRFIIYLSNKLHPILYKSTVYYYTFAIFPRLVLITALFIDTFYFHYLSLIYKVLLIGILLVVNRYIIYSLKYAKEHFIIQLEPLIHKPSITYDHQIYIDVYADGDKDRADEEYDDDTSMCLELSVFIKYASESIYYYNNKRQYIIIPKREYKERYCKKHQVLFNKSLPEPITLMIFKEIDQKVENILKISVLLLYYELYNEYTPEIKNMKILIFSNYLLCWLYILIVSIPTVSFEFNILPLFIENIEPFSGLPLMYEFNTNEILLNTLNFLYEHLFKDILYDIINKEEPFSGLDI